MKVLSYTVIGYMLLALMWWSVLLYRKNHQLFETKIHLLQSQSGTNLTSVFSLPEYVKLEKEYKKQTNMILGEAMVFGLSLMIGLYLINRAFQKELAASKSQNNFLLSVTHELKSPLTSIRLGLETFKKRTLPQEMIHEIADASLQETERLQKLIDQLLYTAKVDTKGSLYNLKNTNISELIANYITKIESGRPDVKLNKYLTSDIHANVDGPAFETAISNIVENAIKYANNLPLTISLTDDPNLIKISVSDEGPGIPAHEKKLIFNKFYRIGSEETRTTKGTGLGLYICKKIIQDHGGTVTVEDNDPKGSVFIINIPKTV